jgi:hypothetical protein
VTAMAKTIAHSPAPADSNVLARFAVPAPRAFLAADRGDVLVSLLRSTEGTILGVPRQKPRTAQSRRDISPALRWVDGAQGH